MILPVQVQGIVRALYEQHLTLAHGNDDQRRQLARMIADQARFELGPTWGHKSADPGRPPSKDAIAQQQPDGRLFAWDLFNGTTREPNVNPESIDITGQTFIDVSPGVDHLGSATPVPVPRPPGTEHPPQVPPPPDLGDVKRVLADIVKRLQQIEAQQQMPLNGRVAGLNFTLTPQVAPPVV